MKLTCVRLTIILFGVVSALQEPKWIEDAKTTPQYQKWCNSPDCLKLGTWQFYLAVTSVPKCAVNGVELMKKLGCMDSSNTHNFLETLKLIFHPSFCQKTDEKKLVSRRPSEILKILRTTTTTLPVFQEKPSKRPNAADIARERATSVDNAKLQANMVEMARFKAINGKIDKAANSVETFEPNRPSFS